MSENNIIDIILLTYNNIDNTKLCINHLYRFTENFGLIVVDNNSTDGTVPYLKDIANSHTNLTLFLSPENLGCVKGRNFAYSLTNSPKVIFLDNDQFIQYGWVESYYKYFNKGYDIVGFEGWGMKKDFMPYKKVKKGEEYNYCGCGGMMIKREVIDDIGLFDEKFNPLYFEDPDLCFRAYEKGYKICWNEYQKIFHKPHKLLNSERRVYFHKSLKYFREKWKNYTPPVFINPVI